MKRLTPAGACLAWLAFTSAGLAADDSTFNQILARAQVGDVRAETMVGLAYCNGMGVTQDYQQAYTWLKKAADANDPGAKSALGWLYEKGYGVAQDEHQAFQWYLAGANGGNSNGQESVGECYAEGKGVEKDETRALSWYRKAAAQGNPMAQTRLGLAYQNGMGVEKNPQQAFTYFLQAAGRHFGPAQYSVALCYWNGFFVPRDPVKAYAWCTLALKTAPDKQTEDLLHQLIATLTGPQLEEGDALVDSLTKQQTGGPSAAPLATTFASGKSAKMPFRNVMGHIVITGRLAGHANLQFLIDTGASASFLDQKTADALGIRPGDTYSTGSGIGKDLLLSAVTNPLRVDLPGLGVDGISFRLFSTSSWDRPIGLHLDGILGIDVLRHFGIRLDYKRRTIEFTDPAALDVSHAGDAIPLDLQSSLALVATKVTKFKVESAPTLLILDTGSNESVTLSRNFLVANPGLKFSRGVFSYSLGGGGAVNETVTRCAQVQFGDMVITNPLVHIIMQNQGLWANGWAGSIGNEVLQRFDVTIDFAGKTLYLRPNTRAPDIYEEESGLVLKTIGWIEKKFDVASVAPESIAERAGFKPGDILVQVDGLVLKGLSLDQSCALLRQPTAHRVVVTRHGQTLALELPPGG